MENTPQSKIENKDKNIFSVLQENLPATQEKITERASTFGAQLNYLNLIKGEKGSFRFYVELVSANGLTIALNLFFSKSKYLNNKKISTLDSRGGDHYFSYSQDVEPHDILAIVESNAIRNISGYRAEIVLQEYVAEMITKDGPIYSVRNSSKNEDIQGVDMFVGCDLEGFGKREVPIQVKTNLHDQIVHQKEHSNIPSILVSGGDLNKEVIKEKILFVLKEYVKGNIVHI